MLRSIARPGLVLLMCVSSGSYAAEINDAGVLTLFGTEAPHPAFVQPTKDGGLIVGGGFDVKSRIFLSRIGSTHNVEWTYTSEPVPHGLTSTLHGAVQLGNGNISVCGIDAGAQQAWAVLLDHNGQRITSWKDDNRPARYATSEFLACMNFGGGMVAAGTTYVRGPKEPELHVLIVAFDEHLKVLWKTDFPVSSAGAQMMQLRSGPSNTEMLLSVVDRRRNTAFFRLDSGGAALASSTVQGNCLVADARRPNPDIRILCYANDGDAFTASLPTNLAPQNIRVRTRFNGNFTSAVVDNDGSIVAFGWEGTTDLAPSVWVFGNNTDLTMHLSRSTGREFGFLAATTTAKNEYAAISVSIGRQPQAMFVHNLGIKGIANR